jgi:outer membrane protein
MENNNVYVAWRHILLKLTFINITYKPGFLIKPVKAVLFGIFLFINAPVLQAAAQQNILSTAQDILRSGQPNKALDILLPLEGDMAGDVEYDYLLGIALLDSGYPGDAVFALQRVLAVKPKFAGARMDLARAYFALDDMNEAAAEFKILKKQSPPANIKTTINIYLNAIENKNLSKRRGWNGFYLFGIGNDSNANNGSTEVGGIEQTANNPESIETESSLMQLGTGITYKMPVDYYTNYSFSGNIFQRTYPDAEFINSLTYSFSTAYKKQLQSKNVFAINAQYYSTDTDGEFNNQGLSISPIYEMLVSNQDKINLFAKLGSITYTDDLSAQDVSQTALGINWLHVFSGSKTSSFSSSFSFANDAAKNDDRYTRNYYGLSATYANRLTSSVYLNVSLSALQSDYDEVFLTTAAGERSDTVNNITLGINWKPAKNWSVNSSLRQAQSSSNETLFEYDKLELLFIARSDFSL